ncbi:M18 family aminopeptidase [Falsarthrobacter nasiphocae]|uniref:M18 family aminopeptidase n=1 Tax=Falsarthrobacter nasiphocae TaxID=189863 RepID=A0AAE3YI02_9MICC|nr:M18 family aminopeptidase [Falsarthrobacter nasiphocae]MDR6892111.1 aspartyl aminopeptidase [Falsarthrobacter nasiphocae]
MSAHDHAQDLARFVTASPSSYHAAAEAVRRLAAAGFRELDETKVWDLAPGAYVVRRDGAFIAFLLPEGDGPLEGADIVGAHTDSPGFKLKPKPTTGSANILQAGVEVYGGPLLNSWLDRELRLAGRLVLADGTERLVATEPILRIPQLAVHLDRAVNADGLKLDRQQHTQPIWGLGDAADADILAHLAELAGVEASEIAGYDLVVADGQEPRFFGAGEEFLASGRLDNLTSVHAGLTALIRAAGAPWSSSPGEGERDDAAAARGRRVTMLAAFDHEEIGSGTRSGAGGPFLEDVLTRIVGSRGPEFARMIAGSVHVSSDAGHAVHPNYPERHDPAVRPVLGGGMLLKINADQRYATDGVGAALISRLARESGAAYQEFVSKNTMPCGSTIGPITATRLGIRTVDVGVPLLSMHSAREMLAVNDYAALTRILEAFCVKL